MVGGRRWWWVCGAVVALAAAAGVLAWALWPRPAQPRARQYLAFTACLLTDEHGVTGPAAPAWAGLQDASLATRAKVQYLSVVGPATQANAAPYLASLLQRHCDVIVAVGPAQVAAASASAGRPDGPRFVLVGGQPTDRPDVTVVGDADPAQVRRAVRDTVESAVRSG